MKWVLCRGRHNTHKARNIAEHLPRDQHAFIARKLVAAWRDPDPEAAERSLAALARSLEKAHPGAAESLREGLAETLTITRLGLCGHDALWRTLRSTNPVEQFSASAAARPATSRAGSRASRRFAGPPRASSRPPRAGDGCAATAPCRCSWPA
jgi:transposase-like protein